MNPTPARHPGHGARRRGHAAPSVRRGMEEKLSGRLEGYRAEGSGRDSRSPTRDRLCGTSKVRIDLAGAAKSGETANPAGDAPRRRARLPATARGLARCLRSAEDEMNGAEGQRLPKQPLFVTEKTRPWTPNSDSPAAIWEALDAGINWIDTAAVYGLGHSEEVVAKALRVRQDRPYVFTKCSMVWNEHREIGHSLK